MGAVGSQCAPNGFAQAEHLPLSSAACGNCEDCSTTQADRERLQAARAGLEAFALLSGNIAASSQAATLLSTKQRQRVEEVVDQWCKVLSASGGVQLTVCGELRRVSLGKRPMALAVEMRGRFPLALMEHIEMRKSMILGHECTIIFADCGDLSPGAHGKSPKNKSRNREFGSFSRNAISSANGSNGAQTVLRFSFMQHCECLEFALTMRALQLIAPALQEESFKEDDSGSARTTCSSGQSARSEKSGWSASTNSSRATRGSGKRKSWKQRTMPAKPTILIGAAPRPKSFDDSIMLSRTELRDMFDEQEASQPLDSPSARRMKVALPAIFRLPHPPTRSFSPNSAASEPLGLGDSLAERLKRSSKTSKSLPPSHTLDSPSRINIRRLADTPRGVNAQDDDEETRPPIRPGTPRAAVPSPRRELPGVTLPLGKESSTEARVPTLTLQRVAHQEERAHDEEWRRLHQFRRARLVALIGPCPQAACSA